MLTGLTGLLVVTGVHSGGLAVVQADQPTCGAQSDPDTTITANAGGQFAIGLAANHTTGYSWQLTAAPDEAVAQLLASVYVLPDPSPGPLLAGAGGRECWLFSAIAPGQSTLTLDYRRPFDPPEVAPERSASFTITVQ